MTAELPERVTVSDESDGERLDVFLAVKIPALSRARAQKLIKQGFVRVDGRKRPQGFRLRQGMEVEIDWDAAKAQAEAEERGSSVLSPPPELDVLYEDEYVLAIDKRPGVIVHPGAGHRTGTLVDSLLASGRRLALVYGAVRAGLVHRLDKDTSGVLLVAKTDEAHAELQRQFAERTVQKAYLALVLGGKIRDAFEIRSTYARRRSDRKMFTSRSKEGREAITFVRTLLRGEHCALVLAFPKTGRTHQIRVHLAEHGHPVVGDRVYGRAYPRAARGKEAAALRKIGRQALHAYALCFTHPDTRERMTIVAPLPRDMREVLGDVFGGEAVRGAIPRDPFQSGSGFV